MRVLFQNHGVVRFTEGLTSNLRALGCEVDDFWYHSMFESVYRLRWLKMRPMLRSVGEAREIFKLMKKNDVFHLNEPLDGELGILSKISARPLVVSLHGTPANDYDNVKSSSIRALAFDLRYSNLRSLHETGGQIVTQSVHCSRALQEYSGISSTVIYNGVESDLFTPSRPRGYLHDMLGLPHSRQIVLWSGRGHAIKDPLLFLRSAEIIGSKHPSAAFVMILWYKGPMDEQILDFVGKSPVLGRSLHIVRRIPSDRMPDVYASSDLLVHTSPYEGFGNVVAEAMSSGKPVVIADRGGPTEYVGAGGLRFKAGDLGDLCEKVDSLMADDLRRKEMGDAGRRIVCTELSWRRAAEEYSNLYRLCVDG
jgi:glycosyltransferase involved in cell wall biosynthesis